MKSQKLGFGFFLITFSVKPPKRSKNDQKVEDNTAPEISPTVLYFIKNVVLHRQFYKPIYRNCLWEQLSRLFLWLDMMPDRPENANIYIHLSTVSVCLSVCLEQKRNLHSNETYMSIMYFKAWFYLFHTLAPLNRPFLWSTTSIQHLFLSVFGRIKVEATCVAPAGCTYGKMMKETNGQYLMWV